MRQAKDLHEIYVRIGTNIRYYRIRAGLTQETLSSELGISRPSLVSIEQGKQRVQIETLLKFSELFGIDAADLMQRGEEDTVEVLVGGKMVRISPDLIEKIKREAR